jgi:serine/threonine protein kinase
MSNWSAFADSSYPWERDALDFVRERFPDHEPWRAWSLFEFIGLDGSVNEVDLLVFSPWGFFLIEIKSRPGRVTGDAGTWTWETDGRLTSTDNPLKLANLKAKKLRALLEAHAPARRGGGIPFIEPLVFLSDPRLVNDITGTGRLRVCLRDRDESRTSDGTPIPAHPGIMAALRSRQCPGLDAFPSRGNLDRPTGKLVAQAIDAAGIRHSNRQRRVSDYRLEQQIDEGKGFQDWAASHVNFPETRRRIRIRSIRAGAPAEERAVNQRAAIREFQLLENLQHPGILRVHQFTEHELGSALIFEHDPTAIRLDHFLKTRDRDLPFAVRLDLVRQLAEVMQYAHKKRVVHRALAPQSVLVLDAASQRPRLKVYNWQAGYRSPAEEARSSHSGITATSHVGMLVDDPATAYMAPEVFVAADNLGEHLDVFSLGAVAYHILAGAAPAADWLELAATLRASKGLELAKVLDAANGRLCELVRYATHPEVANRVETVDDFLELLDQAENELTAPIEETTGNPADAQAGAILAVARDPGALPSEQWWVRRRIGQGSSATAFLVSRGPEEDAETLILKIASTPEASARLREEAATVRKLNVEPRHRGVVAFVDAAEIGPYAGFLMRPVYADLETRRIETLGGRLRKEGRLHVDLLERLGSELIEVVRHLEKQGVTHRDIKPDNIAIGLDSHDHSLQLVLFDFSLSSAPPENIRAGTVGYLDPMLPTRRPPPRFDTYAERYAVAATLHEMATGTLPKWGDGRSDPSQIDAEITVDADLFDTDLRVKLANFFRRAFRRQIAERFDNAEQMLAEWRECFTGLSTSPVRSDRDSEEELERLLASATLQTGIASLGLGTRATNALDRANVLSVKDLLQFNRTKLGSMRGVGNKTRREITTAVRILRDRLLPGDATPPATEIDEARDTVVEPAALPTSIEGISASMLATFAKSARADTTRRVLELILGRQSTLADPWPTRAVLAGAVDVTRARVGQIFGKLLAAAARDELVSALREELVAIVGAHGGVMTAPELAEVFCETHEGGASREAMGIIRIAVDTEMLLAEPRLTPLRRDGETMFIAAETALAEYALRLGRRADRLAEAEPLASPAHVLDELRQEKTPERLVPEPLTDTRLVRLAAAASKVACVSSRQELYPRGMDALRALKLSLGAVSGVDQLTEKDIAARVMSRYPDASPLPPRPALDDLLRSAGLDLHYDSGAGSYLQPRVLQASNSRNVTSGSHLLERFPTAGSSQMPLVPATPSQAAARQFEGRLQNALKQGSFLQLVVTPRDYDRTAEEFSSRFPVTRIDVEEVVLDCLQATAKELGVDWKLVLATDAAPGGSDWPRLLQLVGRARPAILDRLCLSGHTPLLVYSDILVRYQLKPLLLELQQRIGHPGGPNGIWLLVPGRDVPLIAGQPIGVPGQQAAVPPSWVRNEHRAVGAGP